MDSRIISGPHITPPDKKINPDDDTLQQAIRVQLHKSPYPALRQLLCEVKNGIPTLRGRVTSYYYKQLAQSAALRVVKSNTTIKNRIEVIPRK